MRYIIGVDLGGTQIRVGLSTLEGEILKEERTLTLAAEGPEAVIGQIVDLVALVRKDVPEGGEVLGIGIGSPGPLDPFTGVVFNQPNMTGWVDVPLRDELAARTGLPVELGNDANAAGLGEWLYGGGKGTRNMVYVTISTGIGVGVIADGRLLLGHKGSAAEGGHHIIDWQTRETWENLAAGAGVARAAAALMPNYPDSLLHKLTESETLRADHVTAARRQNDPLAVKLMEREGDLIGVGLVNILYMYSPELILLGGGIVTHNPYLIEHATKVIRENVFAAYQDVPVRLAELGGRAGLLGAVALYATKVSA